MNHSKDIQRLALNGAIFQSRHNRRKRTCTNLIFMETLLSNSPEYDNKLNSPIRTHTYLNLHIKHSIRVYLDAKHDLHMMREPLLVALLDFCPFSLESFVVDIREKPLEERQVFEPDTFVDLESLCDEGTQVWVTLS